MLEPLVLQIKTDTISIEHQTLFQIIFDSDIEFSIVRSGNLLPKETKTCSMDSAISKESFKSKASSEKFKPSQNQP